MKKIAYLFPGQGSQIVGMGKSFKHLELSKELFSKANEALGFDLQQLCYEGPEQELILTQNAQPAILTVSVIAHQIFHSYTQQKPDFLAGHSLGEYTALVVAGVLKFEDAVKIVHLRGKFMQEAVPIGEGTMAVVLGESVEKLTELCHQESKGEYVAPANFNTKGQIVIAGHTPAVKRVLQHVKGKLLDVSAPFHTVLMESAAQKLQTILEKITFHDAHFPIINNVDNQILEKSEAFMPSLVKQVTGAVKWESGIYKMLEKGVSQVIEFGEGKVLTGMMKRIDKSIQTTNISKFEDIEEYIKSI